MQDDAHSILAGKNIKNTIQFHFRELYLDQVEALNKEIAM